MSNPRFELTGDAVEIVEDVWNIEDTRFDEERAPVFTFDAGVGAVTRARIVTLLNDNLAGLAAP